MTSKQAQPNPTCPKLRSDYLHFRLEADKIFNDEGEEESKGPQEDSVEPQLIKQIQSLLRQTEETFKDKKEQLLSQIRVIQTDAEYLQNMALRSNQA